MDIFRFTNPTAPTKMEQGRIINGIKTKMWVERYAAAGEFTFTAPISSGLRTNLPIGSFISHLNTQEIMIVENHEINDEQGTEPQITVTGRGLETFLENRFVGANKNFPIADSPDRPYILDPDYSWNQALNLIKFHSSTAYLIDDDYAFPYLSSLSVVSGVSTSVERQLDKGTVYDRLLELLAADNLGIKVIRPGPWSPLPPTSPNTTLLIHVGTDRTSEVAFSYDTGEIVSADYLWSNRTNKNAAYVVGRWVELVVNPTNPALVGYNRRMMMVDASDLDGNFDASPTGTDLTNLIAAFQQRGIDALASQNDIALTKAQLNNEAIKSIYRADFDVGDLITISGDYNESTTMRISEYVEIEDETGESGYPTLSEE